MIVKKLLWYRGNIAHIARHDVIPAEVSGVLLRNRKVYCRGRDGKYVVCGVTDPGRYLTVIVAEAGEGVVRVITARDMTKKEKQYYRERTR
jgi:uncharacterized DUF497 family protein